MKGQEQIFGTGNDGWETNPATFMALHDEFDFEVDVCASDSNALLPHYFTQETSALDREWNDRGHERFFMNPPYTQTDVFMRTAAAQARRNELLVVCLVAARTDTKWWHDLVWYRGLPGLPDVFRPGVSVRFLKGRETFYKNGRAQRTLCKKACCRWPGAGHPDIDPPHELSHCKYADCTVCVVPGAKGHINSAPFPSVVVIFDGR